MANFNINQYEITVSVDGSESPVNEEEEDEEYEVDAHVNEVIEYRTANNIAIEVEQNEEENEEEEAEEEKEENEIEKQENIPEENEIQEKVEASSNSSEPSIVKVPLRQVSHPPKRKLSRDGELFSRWIFYHLYHHRNLQPEKIALIEEVGEARCVTYGELVNGAIKTANYMSHHGIQNGDRVLMCMENSVEYVFYQLGTYLLGAIPVLLKPSHLATDNNMEIDCTAAVVDFDHYGQILRTSKSQFKALQHVFVLADELSAIYIPQHVWIYDGFGFLDFPSTFKRSMPMKDNDVTIFTTSAVVSNKAKFVAHMSKSSQILCHQYYDKLFDLLVEKDPDYTSINGHHLITSGLHCYDAWAYLYYILIKGETCVIAESTIDIWRASFLDRIAGLIEQYRIPLIFSNTQLLKCFIKYEVHNIYDISSLKIIANTGATLSTNVAKQIKNILNVSITQAYSSVEFGVVSFELFDEGIAGLVLSCGQPFDDTQIKVASVDTEKEVEQGEWGQIILSGPSVFRGYVGDEKLNECFMRTWYRTGDYGMVDEKNRIHIGGPVGQLLNVRNKKIYPELIENVICHHKTVDDAVVMTKGKELWCGVLLKDEKEAPNTDQLDKLLKKSKVLANVNKIIILDFIPRSENGKLLRNEVLYLMTNEHEEAVLVENTESSI